MSIRPGDRIGLVGPSGSGKSSLLRAIAMLDQCDSGEVRYDGELICNDAVPGFRRRVAYLPQRPSFVLGTVRENLQLPFRFTSAKVPFDQSLVDLWLHRLAASTDLLNQPVSQLSGGQQQIVALVRAIQLVTPSLTAGRTNCVAGRRVDHAIRGLGACVAKRNGRGRDSSVRLDEPR